MGCIYTFGISQGCGLPARADCGGIGVGSKMEEQLCCSSVLENKGYTEAGRAFLELVAHSFRSMGDGHVCLL